MALLVGLNGVEASSVEAMQGGPEDAACCCRGIPALLVGLNGVKASSVEAM